ncbi:MAG TPA: GMC family oxidoreductase [Gaiellaceae bacterium]
MLIAARDLAGDASLEADVCVVGAGPAGLVVASELEPSGASVLVLAGPDEAPSGEVEGEPYPPLAETHLGGVGGSVPLWTSEVARGSLGARYAPLAPIDFEERDGMPRSGWPFGREALDPFYTRAHELCEAGLFEYDPAAAAAPPDAVPVVGDGIATGVFRFGRADAFIRTQTDRLARSEAARILTGAVATRIRTSDDGREVRDVEVASEPGRGLRVRARAYVLAAGGIENPRLLLLSGIGNDHDLVGRCFMDHPTVRCRLELDPRAETALGFYDVRLVADEPVLGHLALPEETLRAEGLLNSGFIAVPARDRAARAAVAAQALAEGMRARRLPDRPLRTAAEAAAGAGSIAYGVHRRLARGVPALAPTLRVWPRSRLLDTHGIGAIAGWSTLRRQARAFDLYHIFEQAPDPERRVSLGTERDRFGLPVARLHWFIGARELDSANRTEELLRDALARRGLGRLRTARELAPGGDVASTAHPSVHHHLGTTRMHAEERRGVVDANGRVHGLANLFVTGGSVFPTAGFVNPTLTIVALAARLSAHLRQDVLQ